MLWILLTVFIALVFAAINVADKHVITDELRDPILCTVIYGICAIVIFTITALATKQSFNLPYNIILTSLIVGAFLSIAVFFYYKALEHEEVSRVIPLFSLTPLFVLILATIFLKEFFTFAKYAGIVFLICGAFLISIRFNWKKKTKKKKISITPALFMVIFGALLFAIRSILVRQITLELSFLQIIFWFAAGMFLVAGILLAFHHPHIIKKIQKRGIEHLIIINIISALALLLYIKVIATAPAVSLVAAMLSIQGFFIFILATSLSKFKPSIINEKLTKRIIIMKIIAIALLTTGVILII